MENIFKEDEYSPSYSINKKKIQVHLQFQFNQ